MNITIFDQKNLFRTWGSAVFALLFLCFLPDSALAQTTTRYTNSSDSATDGINDTAASCTNPFTRTFSVGTSYTISDVDIGVLMSHTYRSDIIMSLRSPDNTTVTFFNRHNGSSDNFNILFNDSVATSITAHNNNDTATASTIVPPYQRNFAPSSALSSFNGKNAFGTWTLSICDAAGGDSGTFYQADLYLTQPPANYADLSLIKTHAMGSGSAVIYTLSVTSASASTQTATGVTVRDILPAGVTYSSSSGTGTYNSGTGIWSVGSIAPGQTQSIAITVNVTASSGTVITNNAEITASSVFDPDSTPNNGNTGEDDYSTRSFTVGGRLPGYPPSIVGICSAAGVGTTLLDWNNQSWTSGSTTGTASVAALGTVNFAVASQGTYTVPLSLTSDNTGGFGAGQLSLYQYIEYTTRTQVTTTTVTLPTAVPGVQFTVFDVDYAVDDFADKLTVVGSYNGNPVSATLSNGVVNYISGGSAIGDGGADGTSSDGNVVVTFSTPVDSIVITYGNHTTAPADPDGQAISIYDFTFCRPIANLSVTKISSVISDGVSATNPKAIPGATIRYCIRISNAGSGTANNIIANDIIPSSVTYVAGSMRSGTSCGAANTVEDDNATGADESDPFGMSITGTTVTGIAASLALAENFVMSLDAIIN